MASRAEMQCDFDRAMQLLDPVVAGRVPSYLAHMHGIRARVLRNAGRLADAAAEFAAIRAAVNASPIAAVRAAVFGWAVWTLDESIADLADDQMMRLAESIADARRMPSVADTWAVFSPAPGRCVPRMYAGVLLARGRVDEAEDIYRRVLELTTREEAWIDAARCMHAIAGIAARRGDSAEARSLLDRAAVIFERYNATLYLRWAREARDKLSGR